MLFPLDEARKNGCSPAAALFAMMASVAWRWSEPILTGLPSACSRTQASSQSSSVGQTRAHMPPRMFACRIVSAAPMSFPFAICRMNSGMSIEVGQACTQGAS